MAGRFVLTHERACSSPGRRRRLSRRHYAAGLPAFDGDQRSPTLLGAGLMQSLQATGPRGLVGILALSLVSLVILGEILNLPQLCNPHL